MPRKLSTCIILTTMTGGNRANTKMEPNGKNKMTDIPHMGKVDMSVVTVGSMFAADIQGSHRIESLIEGEYLEVIVQKKI